MEEGVFREDLYWRLHVISLSLPPLKQRRDDIPQLVSNFAQAYNTRLGKSIHGFATDAMDLLFTHHWPGNVRELENVVERSMVLAKGDVITPDDLPSELKAADPAFASRELNTDLDLMEREHVRAVLEKCAWNKYKAAKMMGISRSTLYSKIRKHGLRNAS